MPTTKSCKSCSQNFTIEDLDKAFYTKIKVPEPTHCPECRLQRRIVFRNERNLFRRQCDLCKNQIVSTFDADTPFQVYCPDCWWSDKWDTEKYGRDFDFSRPFFEQFEDLMRVVPKASVLQLNNENSTYNALVAYSKNTYMSPGSYFMQDCFYCRKSQYCKDCVNNNLIDHCELVASSVNCKECYNGHHLINCRSCSDCAYVADSSASQYCFMCAGIANGKFQIKNLQYGQEEYKRLVAEYMNKNPEDLMREFQEFSVTIPKKYQNQLNCENSSGDYIQSCKNAIECYDCFDLEDCKYMIETVNAKDSMDLSMHDKDIELCYECSSGGESNKNLKFTYCTIASPNSEYLYSCFYLADSFGCDGIHARSQYQILNKKYSEADYKLLRQKIIDHMTRTGEYGEFFPINTSPYPYNQTLAQDYFPLTREQALAKGYKWKEQDPKQYSQATAQIPYAIEQTPDSITQEILACKTCGRNYRIIAQELNLYKKFHLPVPRKCPECRYSDLLSLKNPRYLYERQCGKCGIAIQTTYAPNRPEKVYCEKCYLGTVY